MNNDLNNIEASAKTISQQVQESIRALIYSQHLAPGERIDQNNLAEQLKVSIVPVREALKGLEADGLVNIIPRRGAFVTELSTDHLNDLYRARQLIEGEAASRAMESIPASDIDALKAMHMDMQAATDTDDIGKFMMINRQFHMTIYRHVNSNHYLDVIKGLWDRSELYRYRYMTVLTNAAAAHQDHMNIITACEARDESLIKQLIFDHIQHTLNGLHQQVKAQQDQRK